MLSEHVDYRDRRAWGSDSLHAIPSGKRIPARAWFAESTYAGDGGMGRRTVGNDARTGRAEVARARERAKVGVPGTRVAGGVEVEVDPGPEAGDVTPAVADESQNSKWRLRGATPGRRLHHVAMLRSLGKIGSVQKGSGFRQTVAVAVNAGRVIASVQMAGRVGCTGWEWWNARRWAHRGSVRDGRKTMVDGCGGRRVDRPDSGADIGLAAGAGLVVRSARESRDTSSIGSGILRRARRFIACVAERLWHSRRGSASSAAAPVGR